MRPYGGWLTFRYLEQNQIFKNQIKFPPRHRWLLNTALARVGFRYKEIVPFYDPLSDTIQWADYLVYERNKKTMFCIQFKLAGGSHKRTRDRYKSKIKYLEQRGIKVLQLGRGETSQIYEAQVRMFIRKLE